MSFKQKYDLIFSLGEACSCSSALRRANLQITSFPFDWLFGAKFLDRVKILTNDFKDLIRCEDLKYKGNNNIPTHLCSIYENKSNGIIFNHDILESEKFEEVIDEVIKKYERRAKRLIDKGLNSKKILAVYIDSPGAKWVEKDENDFIEGQKLLQSKFPNAKTDLLVLRWKKGLSIKKKEFTRINDNIIRYSFDYQFHHKKKVVADYVVDEKMLMEIFKKYELNMTPKEKLENFLHKNPSLAELFGDIIRAIIE